MLVICSLALRNECRDLKSTDSAVLLLSEGTEGVFGKSHAHERSISSSISSRSGTPPMPISGIEGLSRRDTSRAFG